jgi:hypothetical protein
MQPGKPLRGLSDLNREIPEAADSASDNFTLALQRMFEKSRPRLNSKVNSMGCRTVSRIGAFLAPTPTVK